MGIRSLWLPYLHNEIHRMDAGARLILQAKSINETTNEIKLTTAKKKYFFVTSL